MNGIEDMLAARVHLAAPSRRLQETMRTDQRGTVRSFDYDKLGRPAHDRVTTVGSDTDNAVLRIWKIYGAEGGTSDIRPYWARKQVNLRVCWSTEFLTAVFEVKMILQNKIQRGAQTIGLQEHRTDHSTGSSDCIVRLSSPFPPAVMARSDFAGST